VCVCVCWGEGGIEGEGSGSIHGGGKGYEGRKRRGVAERE